MAEDLHSMGVRVPVGERQLIHVPQRCPATDVVGVLEIEEEGKLAVATGFSRVLSGRLTVHLHDAAAGPADLAEYEVDVVHLASSGRRLVRLVDALEHARYQGRRRTQYLGRLSQLGFGNSRDLANALRGILPNDLLQSIEALRMLIEKIAIDVTLDEEQMEQSIQQGDVGSWSRSKVNIGGRRGRRASRIDDDET